MLVYSVGHVFAGTGGDPFGATHKDFDEEVFGKTPVDIDLEKKAREKRLREEAKEQMLLYDQCVANCSSDDKDCLIRCQLFYSAGYQHRQMRDFNTLAVGVTWTAVSFWQPVTWLFGMIGMTVGNVLVESGVWGGISSGLGAFFGVLFDFFGFLVDILTFDILDAGEVGVPGYLNWLLLLFVIPAWVLVASILIPFVHKTISSIGNIIPFT